MSSPLSEQSISFSIDIVNFYKWLCSEKREFVLSNQILRSATSIGANIHEANFAVSKADFISKMQIALKETSETEYWLIVLERTEYGGLELTAEAARFYTSGRARFTPPGGHILQ